MIKNNRTRVTHVYIHMLDMLVIYRSSTSQHRGHCPKIYSVDKTVVNWLNSFYYIQFDDRGHYFRYL